MAKVHSNPISRLYQRFPNLAPILAGVQLFALTDLVANRIEDRLIAQQAQGKASQQPGNSRDEPQGKPMNPCRTLAVMTAAPWCNGSLMYFYRFVDVLCGARTDRFIKDVLPKVGVMMIVWTPISVISYVYLSTYFHLQYEVLWEKYYWRKRTIENTTDVKKNIRSFGHDSATFMTLRDIEKLRSEIESLNLKSESNPTDIAETEKFPVDKKSLIRDLLDQEGVIGRLAWKRIKHNFIEMYATSYVVWPISDVLNFMVISRLFSPNFRATWDAMVGLAWNTYQSLVTFRSDDKLGKVLEI